MSANSHGHYVNRFSPAENDAANHEFSQIYFFYRRTT